MAIVRVGKRMKKLTKRGRVHVDDDGKNSGVANASKVDAKDEATEMNEDNVPGVLVKVKPRKSKKIRIGKKKDHLLSNEESNAVNNAENDEPTQDSPKGKKDSLKKVRKNKRKHALVSDEQNDDGNAGEEIGPVTDGSKRKKDKSKRARKSKTKDTLVSSEHISIANGREVQLDAKDLSSGKKAGKLKKAKKQKNASHSTVAEAKPVKEIQEVVIEDVYQISSGDDDDSKGMKKWIKEYHERRPGIKVLQEQIDDFITAYEEQEEQAKREKQASLAEDGWTVVVHRKGGKKTTDSESGVAVGAVAEAAVREKMAKKKSKDVGLDFYRFQRKEANRSEIMKLQSKFEDDKKRIQQLRAARKFRPY